MADEQLVIEVVADTTGLEPTINLLEKLGKIDAKTAEEFRKATVAFNDQNKALKSMNPELTKNTEALNKLSDALSKKVKPETEKVNKGFGDLIGTVKNLGAAIGIGLGTAAIVSFGKESFKAFTDAEKTAKVLQTAVSVNGGLAGDYEELVKQSKELQKTTIFSDDNIQKVQTMALQFGLTATQVKSLLPVITDFASATGQTLESALEAVLRGTEGMARGLKIYGVQVLDTGSKSEKLANIVQQLTDKFQGQAEVVGQTTFGATERLKNSFNDLQEEVGGFVAELGEAGAGLIQFIANGFRPFNEEIDRTAVKLTDLQKKIGTTLNESLFQVQIDNLRAIGEAVPTVLLENLNKLRLDNFNDEIENLKSDELLRKLEEVKKSSDLFLAPEQLKKQQRIDAINELIAARKIQTELTDEFNKEDIKSIKDNASKEAEERRKANEALRKFTFDELNKNADLEAAAQALIAEREIQSERKLQLELLNIEQQTLAQKRINGLRTFQDVSDLDLKLIDVERKRSALIKQINQDNADIQSQIIEDQIEQADKLQDKFDEIEKRQLERIQNIVEALGVFAAISNEIGQLLASSDQAALDAINARRDASQEAFDEDSQALQDKLDRDQITQAEYDLQLKALKDKKLADDKRIAQEEKKLKQEQAERAKAFAVFEASLNLAGAILKALNTVPPASFVLAALTAALAGVQLAATISTPIPKFHKGKLAKTDSSEEHAIIRKDETILSPENSRNYRKTLEAIHHHKIPAKVLNDFVQLRLSSPNFSSTASKEVLESGLDEYGVGRALNRGAKITNTKQLAKDIASELGNSYNPYPR